MQSAVEIEDDGAYSRRVRRLRAEVGSLSPVRRLRAGVGSLSSGAIALRLSRYGFGIRFSHAAILNEIKDETAFSKKFGLAQRAQHETEFRAKLDLTQKVNHLDGANAALVALVAGLGARTLNGLLNIVRGQDSENNRDASGKSCLGNPL